MAKLKKIKRHKQKNKLLSQRKMMELLDKYCEGQVIQDPVVASEFDLMMTEYEEGDSEKNERRLMEIENEIRELDPRFVLEIENNMLFYVNEGSTIDFSTESIRTVEILFKPYLIGSKQMGIIELISTISQQVQLEHQESIQSNIIISVSYIVNL